MKTQPDTGVSLCKFSMERNLYSVAPPFTREVAPYKRQRVLFLTTRKKYGQTFPRARHHRPLSLYGKGSILNCFCLESRRKYNLHTDLQYLFSVFCFLCPLLCSRNLFCFVFSYDSIGGKMRIRTCSFAQGVLLLWPSLSTRVCRRIPMTSSAEHIETKLLAAIRQVVHIGCHPSKSLNLQKLRWKKMQWPVRLI